MLMLKAMILVFLMWGGTNQQQEVVIKRVHQQGGVHVVTYESDNDTQTLNLELNGETIELDCNDLEVGESRIIPLQNGEELTVERTEVALVIHTGDGEISVPTVHELGPDHVWVASGDNSATVTVDIQGQEGDAQVWISDDGSHHAFVTGDAVFSPGNQVTISGLGDLDEATRERIQAALREAGVDKEIRFNGGPHLLSGKTVFISGSRIRSPGPADMEWLMEWTASTSFTSSRIESILRFHSTPPRSSSG